MLLDGHEGRRGAKPMRRVREQERSNYIILSFLVLHELERELFNLTRAASRTVDNTGVDEHQEETEDRADNQQG